MSQQILWQNVTINDLEHQATAPNDLSVRKMEIQNRIVLWPLNWIQRLLSKYFPSKLLFSNLRVDSGVLNLVDTLPDSQLNVLKRTPIQINQLSLLPSLESFNLYKLPDKQWIGQIAPGSGQIPHNSSHGVCRRYILWIWQEKYWREFMITKTETRCTFPTKNMLWRLAVSPHFLLQDQTKERIKETRNK